MEAKVPQIIVGPGSPDLSQVDDASVLPVLAVDVRQIEISMGEASQIGIEQWSLGTNDITNQPGRS